MLKVFKKNHESNHQNDLYIIFTILIAIRYAVKIYQELFKSRMPLFLLGGIMPDLPNIIFIIVDCLRQDYADPLEETLSKYGFVYYKNAITAAPWTIPSHASIFTGLYPTFHGVHETPKKKLPHIKFRRRHETIYEKLKKYGYETFLISSNPMLSPQFGFSGFDHTYITWRGPPQLLSSDAIKKIRPFMQDSNLSLSLIKKIAFTVDGALFFKAGMQFVLNRLVGYVHSMAGGWPLEKGSKLILKVVKKIFSEEPKNPLFIFMNFMEAHEPYLLQSYFIRARKINLKRRGGLSDKLVRKWRTLYAREVNYLSNRISELISLLKKRNKFDESLIIVTSDHGQLLGEYGRIGHAVFLYDELLRVPLFVKYPSSQRVKLTDPTGKWICLTSTKPLIEKIVNNELNDDNVLYSDTVFSESYGVEIELKANSKTELENLRELEKHRIAVYYKQFKFVFNATDQKLEEAISYDKSRRPTPSDVIHAENKIKRYLRLSRAIRKFRRKVQKRAA